MPTRILREGILTSPRVNLLSLEAEVFFRRLISVADDYGRYTAHRSLLRAALFAFRLDAVSEDNISAWLAECEKAGLLVTYTAEDKACLEILRFKQQQRSSSKYPPQSSDAEQVVGDCLADDEQPRPKAKAKAKAEAKSNASNEGGGGATPSGSNHPSGDFDAIVKKLATNIGSGKRDAETFDLDDPLEALKQIVGADEWSQNGSMWIGRLRDHNKAVRFAIEDFVLRERSKGKKISNRAAYITKRFTEHKNGKK